MSDSPQQRLKRASNAWSRIFTNAKPPLAKPRLRQNPNTIIPQPTTTTPNIAIDAPQTLNQQPLKIIYNDLCQNQSWGDLLTDKNQDYVIRIYAQNVNGIRINQDGGQYKEICKILTEVKADIFCFQEHNLDTTQFEVKNVLRHNQQALAASEINNN